MPARAIDGGLVLVEHVGVVVLAVVAQDVLQLVPQFLQLVLTVVAQDVGELTEVQFSPRPRFCHPHD